MPLTWSVISAFVLDQVFGYQSANKFRENLIILAARRPGRHLGGSRFYPNNLAISLRGQVRAKSCTLGPSDCFDYVDVEIDGTDQAGITYQAAVQVRVADPLQSITPKIRNVTAGSDAGVGVACTATAPDYSGANQQQTIALNLVTGLNKYRLQFTQGSVSYDTWMTGEIESFATL